MEVELRDADGEFATSAVDVRVEATLATVAVSPAVVALQPGATQQFNATLADQFGEAPLPAPAISWSVSGGGTLDGLGLFTAGATPGGPFTVTAIADGVTGTAELNINADALDPAPPTVSITSPSPGAAVSGSLQLHADATDNVGVARVTLHMDDASLGELTVAPYELSVDTTALADGPHEAWATAFDAAGNQATSDRLESKLSQIGKTTPPPGIPLESIISLAQNGIEESRRIQMDLRPSNLDDLGILATIGWFTREFQKIYSHISVEKQISVQEIEIPDSLKTVLFRVMQEAMNNVAKHSKADLARLILRKTADKIELSVEDNGEGFDPETLKQGLGLTSMRERAELSGGTFAVQSTPGTGTMIKASWTI